MAISWRSPRDDAEHLRDARAVFSISAALAEFYKKEFGVTSEVLVAPADYGCEPVSAQPLVGCRVPVRLFRAPSRLAIGH